MIQKQQPGLHCERPRHWMQLSDLQRGLSDRGIIMTCWLDTGQATTVPNRAHTVREAAQFKDPSATTCQRVGVKMRLRRKGGAAGRLTRPGRKLCPNWECVVGSRWRRRRSRSRESLSGSTSKSCEFYSSGLLTQPRKSNPGQRLMKLPREVRQRRRRGFMIRCLRLLDKVSAGNIHISPPCRWLDFLHWNQWRKIVQDPEGTWSLQSSKG